MPNYRNRTYRRNTNWSNSDSYDTNQRRANYPRNNGQVKKHSGCTVTKTEDGAAIVTGWKASKGVLLSLYARPYKGTKTVVSKEGKKWQNLFVTIINKSNMQITKCSGLFDCDTKKLYIKELNLIANPKGGKGGYFGKHISSSYN